MKYFVCRKNLKTGTIEFQKCKCLDIFVPERFVRENPSAVWQFSSGGARKIVERYSAYTQRPFINYDYFAMPVHKIIKEEKT